MVHKLACSNLECDLPKNKAVSPKNFKAVLVSGPAEELQPRASSGTYADPYCSMHNPPT